MSLLITSFAEYHTQLSEVRRKVFIEEQGVSEADEWDHRDAHCLHALIIEQNTPIACGRIELEAGPLQGKIGRVAVLANHRQQGVGLQIMQALEHQARSVSLAKVWLYAQTEALGFYRTQGYTAYGDEFEEAGIAHTAMSKSLKQP